MLYSYPPIQGKLKSMTRLEKAKWLKRAKKELIKRFGTSFDGDLEGKVWVFVFLSWEFKQRRKIHFFWKRSIQSFHRNASRWRSSPRWKMIQGAETKRRGMMSSMSVAASRWPISESPWRSTSSGLGRKTKRNTRRLDDVEWKLYASRAFKGIWFAIVVTDL